MENRHLRRPRRRRRGAGCTTSSLLPELFNRILQHADPNAANASPEAGNVKWAGTNSCFWTEGVYLILFSDFQTFMLGHAARAQLPRQRMHRDRSSPGKSLQTRLKGRLCCGHLPYDQHRPGENEAKCWWSSGDEDFSSPQASASSHPAAVTLGFFSPAGGLRIKTSSFFTLPRTRRGS